ncbi:MAG: hypothetical protein EXS47_01970 [Candidatus Zambryskibacteria bacterium]|nr:hypothetical protein [Candidatus Zambryskibacteria bacterium]
MEKKTKKMLKIESKIEKLNSNVTDTQALIVGILGFEPKSEPGKAAMKQALIETRGNMYKLGLKLENMTQALEVATIAILAGKDTDFAEPTPADALREAS